MDAYLAIISKREVRSYSDTPLADDALTRILQAGRATGSSRNRQEWEFIIVRGQDALTRLAETVSAPDNVRGCQVAVAVVLTGQPDWDGGRVAQNMMLAAWADGIGSCPNTPRDRDACYRILGVAEDAQIATLISLGYPQRPIRVDSDPDAILRRINRKPLAELVRYVE
ncbi:MAG TPA: nitroreductase family protein [Thermomicrobiales bacterium]|nr:nitroreductase family protein [Thermomicrobiales bacterium]